MSRARHNGARSSEPQPITDTAGLGRPQWTVPLDDTASGLAWSPSGDAIAVAGLDGQIAVLGADDGAVHRQDRRHAGGALSVVWKGAELVTGGVDGWLWIGDDSERLGVWISSIDVDGAKVAAGHGRHVTVIGAGRSETLPASVSSVRWAPDGHRLAATGSGFIAWIRGDGSLAGDTPLPRGGLVETIIWSPDGHQAAAGTRGEFGYLWPLDDPGELRALPHPSATGRLLGFDSTGERLGLATREALALFERDEEGLTRRLLPLFCTPHALCWHPDAGVALLGVEADQGTGGILALRCDDNAAPIGVVDLGCPVVALSWNPQGDRLAVAGGDGTVSVVPFDPTWDWRATRPKA